jgi:hypothetical protein
MTPKCSPPPISAASQLHLRGSPHDGHSVAGIGMRGEYVSSQDKDSENGYTSDIAPGASVKGRLTASHLPKQTLRHLGRARKTFV